MQIPENIDRFEATLVKYISILRYMLMHLNKVPAFVIMIAWDGQSFRKRCGSFDGNSLPTPHAKTTWRRAGGRMDLCVRAVGAGSIG